MTSVPQWQFGTENDFVADQQAQPGHLIEIDPAVPPQRIQKTLVQSNDVQIIHLLVPNGHKIPTHQAQGEIILHCLEGRVSVEISTRTHELRAGQMLYLIVNEPFALQGIGDASVLATIISPKQGRNVRLIGD